MGMIRPKGRYGDVLPSGRAVVCNGRDVLCYDVREPSPGFSQIGTPDELLYTRAAEGASGVWRAVGQRAGDNRLCLVGFGVSGDPGHVNARTYPHIVAQLNGCGIVYDSLVNLWLLYWCPNATTFCRAYVTNDGDFASPVETFNIPSTISPTSQGALSWDTLPNMIRWTDTYRNENGLTLSTWANGVQYGQYGDCLADPPEQGRAKQEDEGSATIHLELPLEPRVVSNSTGLYTFGSRMEDGTYFAQTMPGHLIFKGVPVDVQPVPQGTCPRWPSPGVLGSYFATSNDPACTALVPSGHVDTPGNTEVPVRATQAQIARIQVPVWVHLPELAYYRPERVSGVILVVDDSTQLHHVTDAQRLAGGRPIGLYYDFRHWEQSLLDRLVPALRPHDVVLPQWYPNRSERFDQFRWAMLAETERLRAANVRRIIPVVAAFSRGGWISPANLVKLVPWYRQIAEETGMAVGMLTFSWLRSDGIYSIPQLQRAIAELSAGVVLPAEYEPTQAPEPEPKPMRGTLVNERGKLLSLTPERKVEERDVAGEWEVCDIVEEQGKRYYDFVHGTMSFTPSGFEWRPRGTRGEWEASTVHQGVAYVQHKAGTRLYVPKTVTLHKEDGKTPLLVG